MNIGEWTRDGDFSVSVEPVESICSSSGTEVVYCEILDVSVRKQVVSENGSQDNQSCNDEVLEFGNMENSRQADLGQVRN